MQSIHLHCGHIGLAHAWIPNNNDLHLIFKATSVKSKVELIYLSFKLMLENVRLSKKLFEEINIKTLNDRFSTDI